MIQQKFVSSEKTNNDNGIHQDEPELRFPEFNEKWETIKLNNFLEFIPTNSLSKAKLRSYKEYPLWRYTHQISNNCRCQYRRNSLHKFR